MTKVILGLFLFCLSWPVYAPEPTTVSTELEFRNPLLTLHAVGGMFLYPYLYFNLPAPFALAVAGAYPALDFALGRVAAYALSVRHMKMCSRRGDCHVEYLKALKDVYRVVYDDGNSFTVGHDFTSLLEVKPLPGTSEQNRARLDGVQSDIFDEAAKLWLRPSSLGGAASAGHVNLGIKSGFGDDVRLLRNFLVDFHNHSEIASGVLNYDPHNAPAMAKTKKSRRLFAEVIARVDRGEITTVEELADAYHRDFYRKQSWLAPFFGGALRLKSILKKNVPADEKRLELRPLRAPGDAKMMSTMQDLFTARVEYLRAQPGLIEIKDRPPVYGTKEGAIEFNRYLVESGKRWEDYARYLPVRYRRYSFDAEGNIAAAPSLPVRCWDAMTSVIKQ